LNHSSIPQKKVVKEHFDEIALDYDKWKNKNAYYYQNVISFVKQNVRPQSMVLEIGCGTGEVLASVKPLRGVGIDISPEMIKIASDKFPQYEFFATPIEDFQTEEKFDYIIMVDLIDHVYDIMEVFKSIYKLCHPRTKIVLTTINPWWDPIFAISEKIGAKMPEGPHNFIEKRNITKILELQNFSVNYSGYLLLFPKYIPLVSYLANTLGVRIWGLNKFSCVQYMVIQPTVENNIDLGLGCSVIIPCHNEEGNIEEAVRRIPKMGKETEIIVVNDGSQDKTAAIAENLEMELENVRLIDYSPNRGKGYAIRQGVDAATQDVVMILDADLSVTPEELPRFFEPLNKGICQFVNGSRMVYPMEKQAMRTLNLFGNKIFGLLMTFLTGQNLSDTLCGTKAFLREDFQYYQLGIDKWGDYDLLFGAAKLGNKILEVPVHYKERASGESKMKSLRHGCHLLTAFFKGFRHLVFVAKK